MRKHRSLVKLAVATVLCALAAQPALGADSGTAAETGGKILGDEKNVELRFDPTYVKLAADGKL